ncbi:hypothetical protein REPUB_Repub12eG0069200 [Reevesia pubescens]
MELVFIGKEADPVVAASINRNRRLCWRIETPTPASQDSDSSALGFDLEAAIRTTTIKSVAPLTWSQKESETYQAAFSLLLAMYFGMLLADGVFFEFIAFTMFLPVIVLVPQKFAICFTIGCALIFFALKGHQNQLAHMSSKERLPFTLGFVGSMVGTVYASIWLHIYILSVLFSLLQVVSLSYYAISYFPGGSAGLKFISSSLASSVLRCFGM